ncbi:hypothetical protein [Streptomyces sp. 900105755]
MSGCAKAPGTPRADGCSTSCGTVQGDRVAAYEVVAGPVRLRGLELAVLDVPTAA